MITRTRTALATLLSAFLMAALLVVAPSGTAPASADRADPGTGGLDYRWHTKRFEKPYSRCVARLGKARYRGRIYIKARAACPQGAESYQLEVYIERNGRDIASPWKHTCFAGHNADWFNCSKRWSVANPKGSQEWHITLKATIRGFNFAVPFPRWHFRA